MSDKAKEKNRVGSCLDCDFHAIINDRDPNDWFCDDDRAVVCTQTVNEEQNTESKWLSDRSNYKAVTRSCRPYKLRAESDVPS